MPTYSHSAESTQRLALLVGGSGEDKNSPNVMLNDFVTFQKNLQTRGWNVTTIFAQGSQSSLQALPATNKNIRDNLERLLKNANKGDEVMVFFYGHGKPNSRVPTMETLLDDKKPAPQKSHNFYTEDKGGFNMDELAKIKDQLVAKGAKVATVDLSCWSGETQNLADRNSCTITLASKDYVSVCFGGWDGSSGFTKAFTNLPAPNQPSILNIESQFLKARDADRQFADIPEISSLSNPLTKQWALFLKQSDPYNITSGNSKFDSEAGVCLSCQTTPADYLKKEIEQLKASLSEIEQKALDAELKNLQTELSRYSEAYKRFDESIDALNEALYHPELSGEVDGINLHQMNIFRLDDVDILLNYFAKNPPDPQARVTLDPHTDSNEGIYPGVDVETIRPHATELKKMFKSELADLSSKKSAEIKAKGQFDQALAGLMGAERDFYSKWQSRYARGGNNACKDFNL